MRIDLLKGRTYGCGIGPTERRVYDDEVVRLLPRHAQRTRAGVRHAQFVGRQQ